MAEVWMELKGGSGDGGSSFDHSEHVAICSEIGFNIYQNNVSAKKVTF